MIRDPLTGRWHPLPKELYMEQDHQAHVQLFHWNMLRSIALRHPLLTVWPRPSPTNRDSNHWQPSGVMMNQTETQQTQDELSSGHVAVECRFDCSDPRIAEHLRFMLFPALHCDWPKTAVSPLTVAERLDIETFRGVFGRYAFYALVTRDTYRKIRTLYVGKDAIYPYSVGGQFMTHQNFPNPGFAFGSTSEESCQVLTTPVPPETTGW